MASATWATRPDADVRIGEILSRGIAVMSQVLTPYGLIYLVLALPTAIQQYDVRVYHIPPGRERLESLAYSLLFSLLIGTFARAGLAAMGMAVLQGERPDLLRSLAQGARAFIQLLLAQLCMGIALIFGFTLLLVPGFMMLTAWLIVTPVCVLEQLGPIASLKRSGALTKNYRWRMFGLILVLAVVGVVIALVGQVAARVWGPAPAAIVQLMVTALSSVFTESVVVATYGALRAAKEGASGMGLATVFD